MGNLYKVHAGQTSANPKQTHIWVALIKPICESQVEKPMQTHMPMSDTHRQTHGWVAHIKPMLDTDGQDRNMGSPLKAYVGPIIDHKMSMPCTFVQRAHAKLTWAPAMRVGWEYMWKLNLKMQN